MTEVTSHCCVQHPASLVSLKLPFLHEKDDTFQVETFPHHEMIRLTQFPVGKTHRPEFRWEKFLPRRPSIAFRCVECEKPWADTLSSRCHNVVCHMIFMLYSYQFNSGASREFLTLMFRGINEGKNKFGIAAEEHVAGKGSSLPHILYFSSIFSHLLFLKPS